MPADDMTWLIDGARADQRLDAMLAEQLQVSRAEARRLLDRGQVVVDGRVARLADKGCMLSAGARVTVRQFEQPSDQRAIAQDELSLTVLAEGDGWVVVDKPAGMPVHPLEPGETGTVLNAVIARHPSIQGVGEAGLRSGVVHRLDVETSGVLLFATREDMWQRLRYAFISHEATKVYHAVASGRMVGEGHETMWLEVAQHRPARVRVANKTDRRLDEMVTAIRRGWGSVDDTSTQSAATQGGARRCGLWWRALKTVGSDTLVEVRIDTGFLHQIRVMLAYLGHAVVGDAIYNPAHEKTGRDAHGHLLLHASHLTVGPVRADSPLPGRFSV